MAKPIKGTKDDDLLAGTNGADVIHAVDGDDFITGGMGDDDIDGGNGFDTAVFSGSFSDYVITVKGTGNDKVTVADTVANRDGTDSLKKIEVLQFADGTYNVNTGVFTDTLAPTVTSVEVSDTEITDSNAGDTFTVTVTFSEDMDQTVDPTLTFNPAVASTLTGGAGSWTSATTYEATYTVADGNVDHDGVTIDVEGAKDVSGNAQQNYTPESEFAIATAGPAGPALLVVAYINSDGIDGYQPATDTLIAGIFDSNEDGTVSTGDLLRTDFYPRDLDASSTGEFLLKDHIVQDAPQVQSTRVAGATTDSLAFDFQNIPSLYEALNITYFNAEGFFLDGHDLLLSQSDLILLSSDGMLINEEIFTTAIRPGDQPFIDVDILI